MRRSNLNGVCAHRIQLARHQLGWSQEELAARAGLHRTYIGAVERGERNITLKTLERLARALECDPVSLLSR
jgi:transcriptional regulator with XRE-family HTH domain